MERELTGVLWSVNPDVWALVLGLGTLYAVAVRRARTARPSAVRPITRRHMLLFVAGLVVLWIATDGPIDAIGEQYLLSVHMVQFLLLTLVAPPLILLGLPAWLVRRLLQRRWTHTLVRAATQPVIATVMFNAVLVLSHWPAVVELYLRSDLAHLALHTVWVGTALAWWWPVLSPLPELGHLPDPQRLFYLLLQSFVPTVPASFLTFGRSAIYSTYAQAPRLWGLSAVADQQIAGLLMKVVAGFFIWTVIGVLFFRWSYETERGGPDWVYWHAHLGDKVRASSPAVSSAHRR